MDKPCYIGVDLGTSGCRAVAIDEKRHIIGEARTTLEKPARTITGGVEQDPELWWDALVEVLSELTGNLDPFVPQSLCLDGTSSTLLLCNPDGKPIGPALMYNDASGLEEARRIAQVAPALSTARGASSSLAKLLNLKVRLRARPGTLALHQADWLLGRLSNRFGISDWNNCLKLGYDPQKESWPEWISKLGVRPKELPEVVAPGTDLGPLDAAVARDTGLSAGTRILAGTTDSTAAVIAAGASAPGEAVTCLGSTLVLKIIAREPVTAPDLGVYSHRFGNLWLAGGASNSGGTILRRFFDEARIQQLTAKMRPDQPTGLDYYPLPDIGERFPVNDPTMPSRLSPRPPDDAVFFQGLLEGIAGIEAAGYRCLHKLGAARPTAVLSTGGGAMNEAWSQIRERFLGIPVTPAKHQEAAFGSAIIAKAGGVTTEF